MKFKKLLEFLEQNGLTANIADVMGNESTKVDLLNQVTRSGDPDVLADFQQLLRGGNFEQDLISAVEGFKGDTQSLIDQPVGTPSTAQKDLVFDTDTPETRVEGNDIGMGREGREDRLSFADMYRQAQEQGTPFGDLPEEDAGLIYDRGYSEGMPDVPAYGAEQIASLVDFVKNPQKKTSGPPRVDPNAPRGTKMDELHTVQKNAKQFENDLENTQPRLEGLDDTAVMEAKGVKPADGIPYPGDPDPVYNDSPPMTADDAQTFSGNPEINDAVRNPLTENESKMTGGAVPVVADTMNAPGTSESSVTAGAIDPITQAILEQESPAYKGNTLPGSDLVDRPGADPFPSGSKQFETEVNGQKYRGPESGQNTRPNANPTNPQNSIGDLVQQRDGTVPNAETDVPPQNFSDVGAGSDLPNALYNNFGGLGEYVGMKPSPYPVRQGMQNIFEGVGLSPETASKFRKPTDYVTAPIDMALRNPIKTGVGYLLAQGVMGGAQDEIDQLGPGAAMGPDGQLIPEMPVNEVPASEQELLETRSRSEQAMDKWINFSTGASKFDQIKLNQSGPVSNEDNIRQLRKGI